MSDNKALCMFGMRFANYKSVTAYSSLYRRGIFEGHLLNAKLN